jgi:hypothetical protein
MGPFWRPKGEAAAPLNFTQVVALRLNREPGQAGARNKWAAAADLV